MTRDETPTTPLTEGPSIADGRAPAQGTGVDELIPTDEALLDEADDSVDTSRVSGWRRILRGNRTLWIVALCAVLSLVVGLLVGRFLISPAEAGETPDPGLVTVPVEFGP